MEKLLIVAVISAIPSVLFIMFAKNSETVPSIRLGIYLFMKIPAIIFFIALVLIGLNYFNLIKFV